jgi:hypothetical protein
VASLELSTHLLANIRLGSKLLTMTNTLAYSHTKLISVVKTFHSTSQDVNFTKLLS